MIHIVGGLRSGLALLSAWHQVVLLLHSHTSQQASREGHLARGPPVLGPCGAASEPKGDSPFIQRRPVFQKHRKEVAQSTWWCTGTEVIPTTQDAWRLSCSGDMAEPRESSGLVPCSALTSSLLPLSWTLLEWHQVS